MTILFDDFCRTFDLIWNYSDSVVCLIFHLITIARWQFAKAKRYKTLFVSFSYLACCVAILVYAYIDGIGYKPLLHDNYNISWYLCVISNFVSLVPRNKHKLISH